MPILNQSQGGMCICRVPVLPQECFGPQLQDCPAAPPDLFFPVNQSGEEAVDPLLDRGLASQTRFPGGFLFHPPQTASSALKPWQ